VSRGRQFSALWLRLPHLLVSEKPKTSKVQMTSLYAYQISPLNPSLLFYAETLEDCRAAALAQRAELRDDRNFGPVEPMAIYEVDVEMPNREKLLSVLNRDVDLTDAVLGKRRFIEFVED